VGDKITNLIVISSGSFPYGSAQTNRHVSYLRGLVELGSKVTVILINKSDDQSSLSQSAEGVHFGIEFKYATWSDRRICNFLSRYYNFLKGLLSTRTIAKNILNNNPNTCILFLLTHPFVLWVFIRLSRKYKIKIFHERTEFPFLNKTSFIERLLIEIYLSQLKRLNGLFVITRALKNYFKQFIGENNICHIPMTVIPDRFLVKKTHSLYGRYIAYCGSMYTDKDGVPILIKAYDIFAEQFQEINLVLIGDTNDTKKLKGLYDILNKVKNKDKIILTGKMEYNEIPQLLVNAEALALARPDNTQAKGGFPTKLGEYLATGNPVVITDVGEIPDYLIHLENAFIAKSDDVVDFAEKLKLVFKDVSNARLIGIEGQRLAFTIFNYKVQAENLKHFFDNH